MKGVFAGRYFSMHLLHDAALQQWGHGGQCLLFDIVGSVTQFRIDSFYAKRALCIDIGKYDGKEEKR